MMLIIFCHKGIVISKLKMDFFTHIVTQLFTLSLRNAKTVNMLFGIPPTFVLPVAYNLIP